MSRTRQQDAKRVQEPREIKARAKHLKRDDLYGEFLRQRNEQIMADNKTIDNRALPKVTQ